MEAFEAEPKESVHETVTLSIGHVFTGWFTFVSIGSPEMHPKW